MEGFGEGFKGVGRVFGEFGRSEGSGGGGGEVRDPPKKDFKAYIKLIKTYIKLIKTYIKPITTYIKL